MQIDTSSLVLKSLQRNNPSQTLQSPNTTNQSNSFSSIDSSGLDDKKSAQLKASVDREQALKDVFSGVTLNQVADEGLGSIEDDVGKIRSLVEKAGDESLSDDDRAAIQKEITSLQENIQDTIDNTSFAGRQLLSEDGSINFDINARPGQERSGSEEGTSNLSDVLNIDVTSSEGREKALEATDDAESFVSNFRNDISASLSQFTEISNELSSFASASGGVQSSNAVAPSSNEVAGNASQGERGRALAALAGEQISQDPRLALLSQSNQSDQSKQLASLLLQN